MIITYSTLVIVTLDYIRYLLNLTSLPFQIYISYIVIDFPYCNPIIYLSLSLSPFHYLYLFIHLFTLFIKHYFLIYIYSRYEIKVHIFLINVFIIDILLFKEYLSNFLNLINKYIYIIVTYPSFISIRVKQSDLQYTFSKYASTSPIL